MSTTQTPRFNYTPYAWEGSKYRENQNLSTKEIAKLIRLEVKNKFPKCRFSVITEYNKIGVYLMSAPFNAIISDHDYIDVNHFYIENDKRLGTGGREVMEFVNNALKAYNFDDSDSMVDYFHCNFYVEIGVGKWDKPFQIKI